MDTKFFCGNHSYEIVSSAFGALFVSVVGLEAIRIMLIYMILKLVCVLENRLFVNKITTEFELDGDFVIALLGSAL